MKKHALAALAATVFAGLAIGSAAAGEAYGPNGEAIYVPALSFQPAFTPACSLVFHDSGGWMHNPCGSSEIYYAPFSLPEGASVYTIYSHMFDNNAGGSVQTEIMRQGTLWSGGGTPTTDFNYGSSALASVDSAAYQTRTAGASFVYDSYDHNNSFEYEYAARLSLPGGTTYGFRGLWIWFNRQTAPAPASASYSDVPTSNAYFPYVEQLKKAGITSGCSASTFCPDQPVTRAQMAVFLTRALGLHWDINTNPAP